MRTQRIRTKSMMGCPPTIRSLGQLTRKCSLGKSAQKKIYIYIIPGVKNDSAFDSTLEVLNSKTRKKCRLKKQSIFKLLALICKK